MTSHGLPETPAAPAPAAAGWLDLAAAPTFASMALLTVLGGGSVDGLCAEGASPLTGMAAMYALMSLFHSGPWARLVAGWGGRPCRRGAAAP